MKIVYTYHRNYSDIIHWLQTNVGPMLHSQPIMYWHGKGWHVRRYVGKANDSIKGWTVEFNDSVDDNKILLFKIQFG